MERKQKLLSPRMEIRELKAKIVVIKDEHRASLRKELTPLQKRLAVLLAAQALFRAEKALVRSVEKDKETPQLELLTLPAPQMGLQLPATDRGAL